MKSRRWKGAIFDLDGVITQTAKVHFKAWKKTFDQYFKHRSVEVGEAYKPFTYDDYLAYVDGKPRYQGVKSCLRSRDIDIPYGEPSDPPEAVTVCGIGNKKNVLFRSIVDQDGVEIYHSTIRLIEQLRSHGVQVGVASSSMNCTFILEKAGLKDLFQTVIDGVLSKEIGLKGKPHPDIFLVAVGNLGLSPDECLMVEDAVSGVEAGKNGNFALVLGVARNGDLKTLKAHGADIVVEDLKEISLKDIETWFKEGLLHDGWNLSYYGFEPTEEKLRETLTTIGNGCFATRGCFEGETATEVVHYPGTYIAGVYNKLPSVVYRKTIYNNDLVNCPNWLLLRFKIGESDICHPLESELLDYEHSLNMRDGVMSRALTFKDEKGRITRIESRRIASMHTPHIAALQYTITPQNYSDTIEFHSTLDGTVINYGVVRYRELNNRHLSPITVGEADGGICLYVKTMSSKINICMHAKTNLYEEKKRINREKTIFKDIGFISEIFQVDAKQGKSYTVEKIVSIHTSDDAVPCEEMDKSSQSTLSRFGSFDEIFNQHIRAWHDLWKKADFIIEGDRFSQRVVRLHIYHLLVTASPHNKNIDAGMPARGLHGEAYRGHIFWDELFIFPFYNLHFPEITKALLMYRYRRLDVARGYARENGLEGAMYPWQSADDGREESQTVHFNPLSGKWDPDLSRLQWHVSIAIAYNIWSYYFHTEDREFFYNYGVEVMIEAARFWASIATYDEKDARYHINGVMGPDEFHERYPDAEEGGLRDNAYTNIMASWLLLKTSETVEQFPQDVLQKLQEKIGFKMSEPEKWESIAKRMNVVITDDGIISQFDGYMDLIDIDWDHYRKKYGDIHRMDRILKSEGSLPDRYKVSKQADVLMIFYILSPLQLKHLLERMGYKVEDELELMEKNYEYYIRRTSHGSTLSYVVQAGILKHLNTHKKDMWGWFFNALKSDIYDTQGGTTPEGIHTGAMAATIDIITKTFAGITLFKDRIELAPDLPEHWKRLKFEILYGDDWIDFQITRHKIKVKHSAGPTERFPIVVKSKIYTLTNNKLLEIPYT